MSAIIKDVESEGDFSEEDFVIVPNQTVLNTSTIDENLRTTIIKPNLDISLNEDDTVKSSSNSKPEAFLTFIDNRQAKGILIVILGIFTLKFINDMFW